MVRSSLREAIVAANMNAPVGDAPAGTAGLDTIRFAPSLTARRSTYTDLPACHPEDLTIVGPGADRHDQRCGHRSNL